MATEETRPEVDAQEVFGELKIAPIPDGTAPIAAFVLFKLDDGTWSARSAGEHYNRVEFLGQLSAYTKALLDAEAADWFEDDDT